MIKKTVALMMTSGFLFTACAAGPKEKEAVNPPKESEKAAAPIDKPMGGMGGGMGGGMAGGMGGGMSMMDMMGHSKMGCMAASDTMDILLKTVQDARKSNDKAKMSAALAAVETHIAEMKGHMEKCKGMMGMMGMMMGGDGMKGMQGMKPAPDASSPGPKMDPSEHEKHHPK